MTISEAFEAFEIDELLSECRSQKTLDSYRGTLNSFMRAIGSNLNISLIAYGHIIAWKKYMHDCNNSGAHMALQLRELRRVLTYLGGHGFVTLNPAEIKIPKFKYRTTEWLDIEEVSRLLNVIQSPRDKALFACMFSSGARISELLSLNRDSIVNGEAKIWGKGKVKGRDEPDSLQFDSNALDLLEAYIDTRDDNVPCLFPSRQKAIIAGERSSMTIQQCIRLIQRYAKIAGIEKRVTTHVLRHSFATNLEVNGADIYSMSIQMRHKKLETTKIYLHGTEQRKKADYERFHTSVPI